MTKFIPKDFRNNWIKLIRVLQSGKYQHTWNVLEAQPLVAGLPIGHCCLGVVACELDTKRTDNPFQKRRTQDLVDVMVTRFQFYADTELQRTDHNYLPRDLYQSLFGHAIPMQKIAEINDDSDGYGPVIEYVMHVYNITPEEIGA